MRNVAKLFGNRYFQLALIMALCYIIVNAFDFPLNYFDYVLVVYVLELMKINEDNAFPYAIFFGLSYDLLYHIYLGLGVLLFMVLNLIKSQIDHMVDLTKVSYKLLFRLGVIVVYILMTLLFYGYSGEGYWQTAVMCFIADCAVLLIAGIIIGGRRAFWRS